VIGDAVMISLHSPPLLRAAGTKGGISNTSPYASARPSGLEA